MRASLFLLIKSTKFLRCKPERMVWLVDLQSAGNRAVFETYLHRFLRSHGQKRFVASRPELLEEVSPRANLSLHAPRRRHIEWVFVRLCRPMCLTHLPENASPLVTFEVVCIHVIKLLCNVHDTSVHDNKAIVNIHSVSTARWRPKLRLRERR